MSKVLVFFVVLLNFLIVFSGCVGDSQVWENEYGRLEVYPRIADSIGWNFKQFYNVTWKYPSNDLDVAFGFNESLVSGGVYVWNGVRYNKVDHSHVVYNNKHFYVISDISFIQNETKHGYWEYETNKSSGKWDMYVKLSSDTWQYASDNDRLIHLDPWYHSDWTYRKKVTFDHDQIPSDLTNFPVCINITDSDLKNYAQSDGDDILFTNESDVQLNHEIELYDDSDGSLVVWVNVTELSSSSNTSIYMYYNNSEASNQENVSGTWDSDYYSVIHFDDSSTPLTDSVNNNEYAEQDSPSYQQTSGKTVGYSVGYDGTGGSFDDKHSDSTPDTLNEDSFTVSVWCSIDGESDDGNAIYDNSLLYLGGSIRPGLTLARDYETDDFYFQTKDADNDWLETNSWQMKVGYWYHIAMSVDVDTDTGKCFVNGSYEVTASEGGDGDGEYTTPDFNSHIDIGDWRNAGDRNWNGLIDEVRISECVRSENYIKTEYNNLNNATDGGFFTIGVVEEEVICECLLTDVSPVNNSVNVDWASMNLTVDVNASGNGCGCPSCIDYVNISIVNDTGYIFYNNLSNQDNGSFYLDESWSGFTSNTEYTWYVNTSCNGTHNHSWFNFTTEEEVAGGCNCDDIRDIVIEELNNYNALKESDNVEIELTTNIIGLLAVFIIYILVMWRKDAFLCIFATILSLVSGITWLGSHSVLSIGWFIGLVLILSSIYFSFLFLACLYKFGTNALNNN